MHLALLLAVLVAQAPAPDPYFRATVVDDQTGRGVPLVELPAGAYRLEVLANHTSGGTAVIRTADFDIL